MLAIDLTLDPSTTISAGASAPLVYSLLSNNQGSSIRSAASVATTNPRNLRIAHSVRVAKGFRSTSNASVPAPDVTFDRHLIRLDKNVAQTSRLDPEYRVNHSTQIVLEIPRLGAETPTAVQIIDELKAIASALAASSNSNLIRVLNGEV